MLSQNALLQTGFSYTLMLLLIITVGLIGAVGFSSVYAVVIPMLCTLIKKDSDSQIEPDFY